MHEQRDPVQINMSSIPVAGIGGLGLVVVTLVMGYVLPEAWDFLAFEVLGGLGVGIALLLLRRHLGPSGGDGGQTLLFRTEPTSQPRDSISAAPSAHVEKLVAQC